MIVPGGGTSARRSSPRGVAFLRFLGWVVAVILLGLVAMAGLGFYWMHKAKEAGLNPELIRKNRDLAAAELAVIRSGEVRVLSRNDAAGTMVVRDKKTGKTTSLKFDPATKSMVAASEQAKPTKAVTDPNSAAPPVKNSGESLNINPGGIDIPSWVPVYPGASPQNNTSVNDNQKQSGTYTFISGDAPDKLLSYYSDQLASAGMKLIKSSAPDKTTLSAQDSSRTVLITVSGSGDGTHVSVSYEESKAPAKTNP